MGHGKIVWFMCLVMLVLVGSADRALAQKSKPAAQRPAPTKQVVYKTIGDVQLRLHMFLPKDHKPSDSRAAIVFYFGGGWVGGSPSQFYPQCAYLASRGMVAMSAEYRVKIRHKTTPFECVADGKSAVRWIRAHAAELGIDPKRIAAGGGSAGGHVAACTGTIPGVEEKGEDTTVSSVPGAMVLFNPVVNTGPRGYGLKQLGDRYKELSPVEHVKSKQPPTIIFHGAADRLVDISTVEDFQKRMKQAGNRCELVAFKGEGHGFFNFGRGDGSAYRRTVRQMDLFLASLGYLEGEPTIEQDE